MPVGPTDPVAEPVRPKDFLSLTPEEQADYMLKRIAWMVAHPNRPDRTDVMLMDYDGEYLKTKLWKTIRSRVRERDKHVCRRCGGPGSTVHHRCYSREVLEGKDDSMLVTVCDGCHHFIEFSSDDGIKRSEEEKEKILRLPAAVDLPEPKINLRSMKYIYPSNWHRMSSMQQIRWYEWRRDLVREKRHILDEKKARRLARKPVD